MLPSLPVGSNRLFFKVLCNASLVDVLERSGAGSREWIEKETGAELVLSAEEDCYPDSPFRVLGLFADDIRTMTSALELLVARVVELGEEERERGSSFSSAGLLGKEPGEYVFRTCLRDTAAKVLIGPRGANIQALRRDTGAKLFVDNETKAAQQLTRVIGGNDAIMRCLAEVLDIVRQEVGTDGYFNWMQFLGSPGQAVVMQGTATSTRTTDAVEVQGKELPGSARPLLRPKIRATTAPAATTPTTVAKENAVEGRTSSKVDGQAVDACVDRLADSVSQLPPGTAKLQYQIACDLPVDFMGLATNIRDYVAFVKETTETQVMLGMDMDPDNPEVARVVNIVGPLLNIYEAHLLLMGKVEEEEQRAIEEEERRSREWIAEEESKKRKQAEEERKAQEVKEERRRQEEQKARQREIEDRRELEAFDAELARQQREIEEDEKRQALAAQTEANPAEVNIHDTWAGVEQEADPEIAGGEQEPDPGEDGDDDDPGLSPEEIAAQIAMLQKQLTRVSAKRAKTASGEPLEGRGKGKSQGKTGSEGIVGYI